MSEHRRRFATPLSASITPLLESTTTATARSLRGAGDRGKLVGRDGAHGQSATSLELKGNSASRVCAASRAIDVFDPYKYLGKLIGKTIDCRGYTAPHDSS